MQLRSLAGILLLSGSALAAPAARCGCGESHPHVDSVGALQALNYNNLGAENNGTAAVLVYDRLDNVHAQLQCTEIGEKLYPLDCAPQANRTEMGYQLDYLLFSKSLDHKDSLWVTGSSPDECLAYSLGRKKVSRVPCDLKLPALCTSSVPPTTDVDRTVVESSKIDVSFDNYTVTGYRDKRSFRFLGVPFADAPVGELRLAPPRPYSGPTVLDATNLADSCIQSVSGFGTLDNGDISEDCLYLNIYTPILPGSAPQHSRHSKPSSAKRPVAVYFYGGAFTKGTSAMVDYDGGNFASRNDVVVVTINYRVGALGWLVTGDLTEGSYGTRDQILALEWINKHIAAFGGDPSQVTIFGQSAGGQSVMAMLSSTAAKGLFSGALVQSAPVDLPWYTRDVYAQLVAPEVAKVVGCEDSTSAEKAMLACLRSVPATNFLDNSTAFKNAMEESSQAVAQGYLHTQRLLASIEPLMPMVDDSGSGVIDDQFDVLLSENRLPNRVPTMFTTVSDEAGLYIGRYVPNLGSTQAGLNALFGIAFPAELAKSIIASDAFPISLTQKDGVRNVGADAMTHSEWTCPQAYILRNGGKKTFPHLWEVEITDGHVQTLVDVPEICSPNGSYNATCHSADVLPIWGNLNSKTLNVEPYYDHRDLLHSQLLNDVFGSFFRTRNPNPDPRYLAVRGPAYASTYEIFGKKRYRMPEYQPNEESLSLLGMPPSTAKNPEFTEKCVVFEDYGFTFQHANFTA